MQRAWRTSAEDKEEVFPGWHGGNTSLPIPSADGGVRAQGQACHSTLPRQLHAFNVAPENRAMTLLRADTQSRGERKELCSSAFQLPADVISWTNHAAAQFLQAGMQAILIEDRAAVVTHNLG